MQVAEAKDKLKNLSQSLKTLRSCRKDCNIHMRDLIIDYNCITKVRRTSPENQLIFTPFVQ